MTTSQRPDLSRAPNQSQSRLPTSARGGRATSLSCQLSRLQLGADRWSCKPSGGDPRPPGCMAPWRPGQQLGKGGWLKWRPPCWAADEVERLMKLFSKMELLRG